MQKTLLGIVCISSYLVAADTVVIPDTLTDIPHYCARIMEGVDDQSHSLAVLSRYEALALLVLHKNANTLLKERAWPTIDISKHTSQFEVYYTEQCQDTRCDVHELEKTYDSLINKVKQGWQYDVACDGWISFLKPKSLQYEEQLLKSVIYMCALQDSVHCSDNAGSSTLFLDVCRNSLQRVESKFCMEFPKE